jgi:hypothetical protein
MEIPSCTLRLAWLAVLTPILATAGAALRNMRVLSRILKALPKTLPKTLPKGLVVPKMSVPKLPVLTRVKVFAGRVRIASRAGIMLPVSVCALCGARGTGVEVELMSIGA